MASDNKDELTYLLENAEALYAIDVKEFNTFDSKKTADIVSRFDLAICNLLGTCAKLNIGAEEKATLDEIKRLSRLVSVEEKFIRTYRKIWIFRKQIAKKDSQFFTTLDIVSKLQQSNQPDDKNDTYIDIVRTIQGEFPNLTQREQSTIWNLIIKLLQIVLEYKDLQCAT